MASLTTFSEQTRSDAQSFLHHLPSSNQSISKLDKEPASWKLIADLVRCRLQTQSGFPETVSSSKQTLWDLLQARQIWTDTVISAYYMFEAQHELLKSMYSFRKPKEVQRFLEKNKFLAPLLSEAYLEIRKYFPDSQIFLEVDTDSEEINSQQLVAFIATNCSPDEALRKLKLLDENWWLDNLDWARGKLCINVEFA